MRKKSVKLNVIFNVIRTSCSVIFPLITFPYISRVLQADNYGKVNYASSIVSYFALIAALGISNYAIREGASFRNDRARYNQFANQVFTINLITTVIAYILLGGTVFFVGSLHDYTTLIAIQSAAFLFTTLGVEWLYSTYEEYFYITVRSICVQVVSLIAMFAFVRTADDYVIYAAITVFSSAGAYIFNFIHSRKYVHLRVVKNTEWKNHIKPMLIMFCNSLTITIYINSDTTVIGAFMGDYAVGIYSVATRVYTIVKQLLNSITTVILPRCSALIGEGKTEEYNRLFEQTIKSMLTLVLPAMVGLFMLSDEVILLIAGESYLPGTTALRILSLALGCAVIAYTLVQLVLLVWKKDKQYLRSTVISAVANLVLNFVAVPLWGWNGAALTTLLAEGIVLCSAIWYSRGLVKVNGLARTVVSCGIGCAGIVLVCLACKMIPMYILRVIVSIIGSVAAYGVLMLLTKNEIALYGLNMVKSRFIGKGKHE